MIGRIFKGLAPIFAIAAATALTACNGNISINDEEGVPLSELDTTGKSPTELVVAGQDAVIVSRGDTLDIDVSGDPAAVEALRFTLDENTLGIMRAKGEWSGNGKATVRVTLPTLEKLVVAGSGSVDAAMLTGSPEVVIAGSGTARTMGVEAEKLDVTIAGTGTYEAAGAAGTLDLKVAGSGSGKMAGLRVDTADISIAGSGDAEFASDGTVHARIMGSGDVSVIGSAKCTINSMGSGTLRCSPAASTPADGPTPQPAEAE